MSAHMQPQPVLFAALLAGTALARTEAVLDEVLRQGAEDHGLRERFNRREENSDGQA